MSGTRLPLYLERISEQLVGLLHQNGRCSLCLPYMVYNCVNSPWTKLKEYCDNWVASRAHLILAETSQQAAENFQRLANEWETSPTRLGTPKLVLTSICIMIATLMGCTNEEFSLFSELYADNVNSPCARIIPPRGVLNLMFALSPSVAVTTYSSVNGD